MNADRICPMGKESLEQLDSCAATFFGMLSLNFFFVEQISSSSISLTKRHRGDVG